MRLGAAVRQAASAHMGASVGIFGYVCVSLVVLFVLFVAYAVWSQMALEKRIREEGKDVQCWIVMANDKLYKRNETETGYSYAVVVFSFDKTIDSEALQQIAADLPRFKQKDKDSEDERIIASVMRTLVPYFKPLRLPDRITDGAKVYVVSLRVYWRLLPHSRLNRPYVWARVLLGKPGGALMIEYPQNERRSGRDEYEDDEDDA